VILAAARQFILPQAAPAPLVFLLALLGAAAWHAAYRLSMSLAQSPPARVILALARVTVGTVALLLATEAAGRIVALATALPLWPLCLAGAAAVEIVVGLYAAERKRISPRVGLVLLALRITLVLLLLAMLTSPVFVLESSEQVRRTVALLIDRSASMQTPDTQLEPWEKVRLADAIDTCPSERPARLENMVPEFKSLRQRLTVQAEWLSMLAGLQPETLRKHMKERKGELNETLSAVLKETRAHRDALSEAIQATSYLGKDIADGLGEIRSRLSELVQSPLQDALDRSRADVEEPAERHGALLRSVLDAGDALDSLSGDLSALARQVDTAFYGSLSDQSKQIVDGVSEQTRFALVQTLLKDAQTVKKSGGRESFVNTLAGTYALKTYVFGASPVELSVHRPGDGPKAGEELAQMLADAGPAVRKGTDLAAAIARATRGTNPEDLAGIVLMSDGCHNAPASVDAAARRAGAAGIPICSIVLGGQRPPRDAAVVSVSAPDVIYSGDTLYVGAGLKIDGMAGRKLTVTLREDDREEPLASAEIEVATDRERRKVELSCTPSEIALHHYRVALDTFEQDVLPENNEFPFVTRVSDEKTHLLIIEGAPRWEFRYLKNLFADRDPSVSLQYVLFGRERIADAPNPPAAPASVSRDQAQATSLPQEEAEWMKFDVIVLGDVSLDDLQHGEMDILERFVTDRGGVLIVVAGPRHMPHDFAGTALENILPVRFQAGRPPPPESPEGGYRIALTPEGRQSMIMRQDVDPDRNQEIWGSFPKFYWRDGGVSAKPGASVLAYAVSADGAAQSEKESESAQRRAPLALIQQVGLGRVVMLAFDRTWRLRYRAGDVYHHKFWGQIMRWATAGKLPSGTDLVKLGSDKARYAPGEPIRIRAKIRNSDLSPVANAQVAVNIYQGEKLALRKNLDYLSGIPGLYGATIKELLSGAYRAQLDCPSAEQILASEGVESVETEFAVDPSRSPETLEVAANRELLQRVAELTGGAALPPWQADRVQQYLPPGTYVRSQRHEYVLWNSWPFLLLIFAILTAEWVLRRRNALP